MNSLSGFVTFPNQPLMPARTNISLDALAAWQSFDLVQIWAGAANKSARISTQCCGGASAELCSGGGISGVQKNSSHSRSGSSSAAVHLCNTGMDESGASGPVGHQWRRARARAAFYYLWACRATFETHIHRERKIERAHAGRLPRSWLRNFNLPRPESTTGLSWMRIYVTGCQPLDPPVHSKDALMQSHDKMTKDGDLSLGR